MIRHCVFIRFQPSVTSGEKEKIYAAVAALQDRVPGFLACHSGDNVSPETGMDKGYSEGFIVDFDSAVARDAYLVDEDHKKVGGMIVAAAEGGVEGILVFDLHIRD